MSITEQEAKKRAAKSKRTKTANEKSKQDVKDALAVEKTKTAKLRSELKAIKYLINKNWTPPGGK